MANRIPLYELHKSFGASFGVFAGWEAPINYASVLEEHVAVRKNVGIFDLSHMGRLVVEGLDAFKLLDKLVPRVIESEKGVMVGPTAFLNEQAGIKDDVMLYNLGDRWLVVTNAINRDKIREWLEQNIERFKLDVKVLDKTLEWVLIAVQGPKAVKAVEALGAPKEVLELKPLRFLENVLFEKVGAKALIVSRSGWTGEDGFEIVAEVGEGEKILRLLHDKDFTFCGLAARDSLRMEMGFLLYEHEIDENTTPVEARYWLVFTPGPKKDCVGCRALIEKLRGGVERVRVGLKLSKKARIVPRKGDKVFIEDIEIGEITSGAYSPILERSIAQAYVDTRHALLGMKVEVERRGKRYSAKIVEPPFLQPTSTLGKPAL